MKKLFIFLLLTGFTSVNAYAQEYIETMADHVCECYNEIPEDLVGDEFNVQLGMCILEAAQPHWDEIEADMGITMSNFHARGQELGYKIGQQMAARCTKVAVDMAERSTGRPLGSEEEAESDMIYGTVLKVERGIFAKISLRDDMGKLRKFYLLMNVETNIILEEDLDQLEGAQVYLGFRPMELFDARINEFRPFNVIESLEVE